MPDSTRQLLTVRLSIMLLGTFLSPPIAAQNADLLTGMVRNEEGLPLVNVTIEAVSLESDIMRSAITGQDGRFTLLFPDGGGQYRMTARRIGMVPVETVLIRFADEAQLVWDVVLRTQAVQLEDIEVTADADLDIAALEALLGRELTAEELENLPGDVTDLAMLALLVDGGVLLDGTDTTDAELSVNGLDPEANLVTIDGVETDVSEIPLEGLESVVVTTNSFDVSEGGFGGANVAARTRGGTNNVRGSVRYSFQNSGLTFGETELSPFGRGRTNNSFSGGIGGPLIRNRLFANVSGNFGLNTDPLRSLSTATATDLQRLGVAPDSVNRALDLANEYGLIAERQFGTSRSNRNMNALLRLDFLASDRHTVTFTGRLRDNRNDPASQSQLALPDAGGLSTRSSFSSSVRMSSQFGRRVTSELQVALEQDHQDRDPFLYTPQARVRVTSELDDGSTGITTLVLGGNTGMPASTSRTTLRLSEGLSWLSEGGGHRVRLGGNLGYGRNASVSSSNQLGTYTFNTLSDFADGIPASFQRILAPSERVRRSLTYGVHASDTWRVSSALQLNVGLRVDGSDDPRPPEYNPLVSELFDRRTDQVPSTLFAGGSGSVTWTVRGNDRRRPALVLRGGARFSGSRGGSRFLDQAYRTTGLDTDEREINCIGTGVPVPDWPAFGLDHDLIPSACDPGGDILPNDDGLAPTVTVFGDGYRYPRIFNTSLSLQRYVTSFLRASVSGSYTRGYRQATTTDLNLDLTRGFTLSDEADRPVFVPASAVDPVSGDVRLTDSRLFDGFGTVREVASNGASESVQLDARLRGSTDGGITLNASYRVNAARQLATGFDGGSVAGDPNQLEWGPGRSDRRHTLSLSLGYPIGSNLEVRASGRFVSGSPYTPIVDSDINGDGQRNDRAFIFAPDGPDVSPEVAQGMEQLLALTSGKARACLQSQMGRIADRDSCRGPWSTSLDFNITYRPSFWGLNRRLDVNVRTSNFLRGLDDLLHGSDNAHGWGLSRRPERTLLFVTGFDPVTQRFSYVVNERFGVIDPRAFASRAPFQLTVSARLQIGSDRRRAAIDRLRGIPTPGGRAAPRPSTAETFKSRLDDMVVNPAAIALALRDSLALSAEQITGLEALRDSSASRRDSIVQSIADTLNSGNVDPSTLATLMRRAMEAAVGPVPDEIAAVRRLLRDEQWQILPENIRQAGSARSNN